MKSINWVGVIAAAVVGYLVGFVWYGIVFGEQWSALTGVQMDGEGGTEPMILGFVNELVLALGLGWAASATGNTSFVGGAKVGLFTAIFFAGTALAAGFIYAGDNTGLIPIDGGYTLVHYILMGAVAAGVKLPARAAAA